MSSLGLSGLASGVDTSSIVDKLMALERQSATKITNKQSRVKAEQAVLKSIATKLTALRTAADALKKDGAVFKQVQTVESSDPSRVAVSKLSGAGVGGSSLQVDRLASSARRGYSVGDLSAGGTLTVGSAAFTFSAGATIGSVVDTINARADSPVFAAVVKTSTVPAQDRLILSARTTGETGRFTATSTLLSEDPTYASPPDSLNALYKLNGAATASESETNVLDSAIPGLRVTLKAVTTTPATITVGAPDIDRSAIKSKVKAVVDAYNAVVDASRNAINEKPVANATTTTDLNKGTLFGDTGLGAMLSGLRNGLRESLAGVTGIDDLGDLGIGVPKATGGVSTDDAKAGRFTIDDDKLSKALADDWTKVAAFTDAFAGKVGKLVDAQTGKTASSLDLRVANDDRTTKLLADQLLRLNTRLDAREKRLKAQFAAMETAMQNSQSQQAWLSGQINALDRS